MSIRFRFTLLYTFILALTLSIFGFVLYTIQSQDTLDSLKRDLILSSTRLADATLRTDAPPPPFPNEEHNENYLKPLPFNEFSEEQEFQKFPEREIARVLDAEGNLVASPFGRTGDEFPFSPAGLEAVQNKQDWFETGLIENEEMLIYSRPVIVDNEVINIVQVARPLTERNRTLKSLATTLIITGLLTSLIAFGIGWVFSGITLNPIQRITQTAQKIGDNRDFAQRVQYMGPNDEVGQLASTFNSMLTRLQNAFQKVEHSLEMQRNFVADVSHELRTPLTTLRGNLGLLKKTPPAPPEIQTDILNDMVDESDRLIRLVNDLLLLARADAGRHLAKEPVDISSLIKETHRQAQQLDSKRNIQLHLSPNLNIIGDRDVLKQVLLIAVDNALKHSTGDIKIQAQQIDKQIEIKIQDEGEGISAENLAHIFDRFYRADNTIPGFGLGLPIAKTFVEGMNGEIKMESEINQGSTLTLRFPTAS